MLLRLGGKTILEHVIHNVLQSRAGEVILVLGAYRQEIERAIAACPVGGFYEPAISLRAGEFSGGGAAAVSPETGGILFLAGDQPLIPPEFIDRVITVFMETDALIVRPENGLPAIFNVSLKEELMRLNGDTGGRQLLEKYRDRVVTVPGCPELTSLDIDTEEDYRLLQALTRDV